MGVSTGNLRLKIEGGDTACRLAPHPRAAGQAALSTSLCRIFAPRQCGFLPGTKFA
uniref:Uncharacterized protein n=1 Tax=mine drainage metagenome TaxID=410659 RepID=E6Q023_9ZZZZ